MANITVFSGLSKDNTLKGFSDCKQIGERVAEKGYTMICAGASLGCQNNLIQGALSKRGKVIAVTVPMFAHELQKELKDNAIIAEGGDLSVRKSIMKSMASYGYIILPGGPGTLDELWEVISEKAENINEGAKKKIIIVNTDGFYEPVKQQFQNMNTIFKWKYDEGIVFINEPAELNAILSSTGGAAAGGAGGGGGGPRRRRPQAGGRRSKRKHAAKHKKRTQKNTTRR